MILPQTRRTSSKDPERFAPFLQWESRDQPRRVRSRHAACQRPPTSPHPGPDIVRRLFAAPPWPRLRPAPFPSASPQQPAQRSTALIQTEPRRKGDVHSASRSRSARRTEGPPVAVPNESRRREQDRLCPPRAERLGTPRTCAEQSGFRAVGRNSPENSPACAARSGLAGSWRDNRTGVSPRHPLRPSMIR